MKSQSVETEVIGDDPTLHELKQYYQQPKYRRGKRMNRINPRKPLILIVTVLMVQGISLLATAQDKKVEMDQQARVFLSEHNDISESDNAPQRWQFLTKTPPDKPTAEMLAAPTNRLLNGVYAFMSTGAFYDFALRVTDVQSTIGGFEFNGAGRFTGFQTARTIFRSRAFDTFSGTYTVDSSGSGFIFFAIGQTYQILVTSDGQGLFFADVSSSNFREAGYARRLQ
jgi:hypothetical protein